MWSFGCTHKRTTLPMTLSQRTYVTCLTCGEELAYNWDKMRLEGRSLIGGWQGKAERRSRAGGFDPDTTAERFDGLLAKRESESEARNLPSM